jgi:hypothetical protein
VDDPSFKMSNYRTLLLLIPAISAIFLVTDYKISFASNAQSLSQTTTTECNGGSCYTVSCSNDQPCQTFSSDQPSQEGEEVTTTMQPPEDTPILQPPEDTPADDTPQQYVEVPVEFCDDGLDNDDDGKVDEECGASTFSSALPNDSIDGEEKQQNELYEHSDDES